jgi:Na+(H+)/acetate symporter ActP
LFAVILPGMLWKRATPAAGFWGFLAAILASIGMWAYVHTFPDGWRPQPKATLAEGSVVRLERDAAGALQRVIVERGAIQLVNVAAAAARQEGMPLALPGRVNDGRDERPLQLLAPRVVLADTQEALKFGVEGVPVTVTPGVQMSHVMVEKRFAPEAFNPQHAKVIARSEKAKPMAINMYSAWWSFVVGIVVTVLVSLVTRPKPESELRNLVMGLTTLPDEGPCPWYQKPILWASVVAAILVAVNVIFW